MIYVHCYADSLNLVLKDTVAVDPNVINLFYNLVVLRNLFNRSIKIHEYLKNAQRDAGVHALTVRRLNTVRWSSRELWYDILMGVFQNVIGDTTLDDKPRAVATGLRQSFLRKEIILLLILFYFM